MASRIALVVLLVAAAAPVRSMRVLWMGDPEKPSTPKAAPRPGGADTTDSLLQEAIRNIDQLTSVARSLSRENADDMLRAPAPATATSNAPANAPAVASPPTGRQGCAFTFACKHSRTQPGDKVLVVGNQPALGRWDVKRALVLRTSSKQFPLWSVNAEMEPGSKVEFKFITESPDGRVNWERGDNRCIVTPHAATGGVEATYDKSGERQTVVNGAVTTPAVQKVASSTGDALALKSPAAAGGMAQLHLRVKCETKPGESLRAVGWLPQMGSWKADKAPEMKTSRDEYPYWSVSIDVPLAAVTDTIKYKYMVMKDNSQRWEDAIADRTLEAERRAGGVLAPGMHTYVDDGQFNHGGRVCTYVRDTHERGRVGRSSSSTQLVVPAGMQLVSQEQVRQWEVRVAELEEECMSLKERALAAESTVDALKLDLEEEKRQNEEIMAQMKFVEDLLERMKKIEVQVSELEQTKEVLITRSESLQNLPLDGKASGFTDTEGIESQLAQAASMLGTLDKQIPQRRREDGLISPVSSTS